VEEGGGMFGFSKEKGDCGVWGEGKADAVLLRLAMIRALK